jgi:hypothetical protein
MNTQIIQHRKAWLELLQIVQTHDNLLPVVTVATDVNVLYIKNIYTLPNNVALRSCRATVCQNNVAFRNCQPTQCQNFASKSSLEVEHLGIVHVSR